MTELKNTRDRIVCKGFIPRQKAAEKASLLLWPRQAASTNVTHYLVLPDFCLVFMAVLFNLMDLLIQNRTLEVNYKTNLVKKSTF